MRIRVPVRTGQGVSEVAEVSTYPKLSAGPVGKQVQSIYRDRLATFIAPGQYESKNLLSYVSLNAAMGLVCD
jgi:alpha-mannosidase